MSTNLIIFFIAMMFTQTVFANGTTLSVTIERVRPGNGKILVTVFNSGDGFPTDPSKGKPVNQIIKANSESVVISIENLVEGQEYALAVFHDENDNQKLDTNFIGIPKEGVVVSNNAKGRFGPPKFVDAKFRFVPGMTLQPLRMKY